MEKLSTLEKKVTDFCTKIDKEEDRLYDRIKKLDDFISRGERIEESKLDRDEAPI